MALQGFTRDLGIKLMNQWTSRENEIIALNAGGLSSAQIASLLENRTAKAVRHQAEKLGIKLTGYLSYSKASIELAKELRVVGFTRTVITQETGVLSDAQRYYESIA